MALRLLPVTSTTAPEHQPTPQSVPPFPPVPQGMWLLFQEVLPKGLPTAYCNRKPQSPVVRRLCYPGLLTPQLLWGLWTVTGTCTLPGFAKHFCGRLLALRWGAPRPAQIRPHRSPAPGSKSDPSRSKCIHIRGPGRAGWVKREINASLLRPREADAGGQGQGGAGKGAWSRCIRHRCGQTQPARTLTRSQAPRVNEATGMMGMGEGEVVTPGAAALTSLMSPLNTTSSALSRSIFSFISSWMASASCAACGDGDADAERTGTGRRDLELWALMSKQAGWAAVSQGRVTKDLVAA